MKKLLFLILVTIFSVDILSAQGYEITVKINHLPNQEVILGHHFNERLIPDDTITLNSQCTGTFKGKQLLPGGMYFIFLPNRNYFDLMIDGKNQKFTVENDTVPTKFLENMKITGSLENQIFVDYQKNLQKVQASYQELEKQKEKVKNNSSKVAEIEAKEKELSKSVDEMYNKQKAEHPDMFFTKFLTATKEPQIPESITDQADRFWWYKAHYFDNFDVSDGRLLRTAIYQPKIERYIDNMVLQIPDSLIAETNMLVNKSRSSEELFRFMLVFLFNKYAKSESMVAENVYCSLAEIYVKDAVWDTDSFKTELKKKISRKENCLVGNISKDIQMKLLPGNKAAVEALRSALDKLESEGVPLEKAKPDFEARRNDVVRILDNFIRNFGNQYYSIHQIQAKYKLIVFWEPDCSHCKEEMPKLFKFYQDTLKNVSCNVFAIYMNKSVDKLGELHRHCGKWFDFCEEHGFLGVPGWYNMMNPFDPYRENFDINSTPTFYLLNQKNEIIAKRISHQQAYELINLYDEEEKKGNK